MTETRKVVNTPRNDGITTDEPIKKASGSWRFVRSAWFGVILVDFTGWHPA